MILADRVFLDLENLRFPRPLQHEDDAISWLCSNEDIVNLAKDIIKFGLSPLEPLAVIKKGSNSFYVPEGNRRLCAIQLLNDPQKAPAALRSKFQKLSDDFEPVGELFCVEFPDRNSVQVWIDRLHGGRDEGRGRSQWDAAVKTRRTRSRSSKSNKLSLSILDYGVKNELIKTDDTQKKLAIVQRFVSNPVFKNKLGIIKTGDSFTTNLPEVDFDKLLKKLFDDIVENKFKAHDYDTNKVQDYTNNILEKVEVTGERKEHVNMSSTKLTGSTSVAPKRPKTLPFSQALKDALLEIPSYKLGQLYYSLTTIPAKKHSPLLFVGLWSLIESLTALDDKNPGVSFTAYLSNSKLETIGLGAKKKTTSIREALGRIQQFGNATKHDGEAAGFNTDQLINDYQVVEKVLIKLANACSKKS